MQDKEHLDLLGHVIGMNAQGVWSCSCGLTGDVEAMGHHIAQDIAGQIDARLREAKDGGLVPPQGA